MWLLSRGGLSSGKEHEEFPGVRNALHTDLGDASVAQRQALGQAGLRASPSSNNPRRTGKGLCLLQPHPSSGTSAYKSHGQVQRQRGGVVGRLQEHRQGMTAYIANTGSAGSVRDPFCRRDTLPTCHALCACSALADCDSQQTFHMGRHRAKHCA